VGTGIALERGRDPERWAPRGPPGVEITDFEEARVMKRANAVLVLAVIATVMVLAPMVWAAEVQGKIKSVDQSGKMVTLDDGTQLAIPPTLTVEKRALQPGVNVKANYEEKDGQKVATSLMVMPSR
jgi:hypothetical protein